MKKKNSRGPEAVNTERQVTRMPPVMKKKLKEEAKRRNVSTGHIVRECLSVWQARYEREQQTGV